MGVVNSGGALFLATGIDNSGLRRGASEAEAIINRLKRTAERVGIAMGIAFTLDSAKELITNIVNIRGEFQKLEAGLSVLLQSKTKANALMREIVELAGSTPFSLQDVARGSERLLAYGFESKEVISSLRMLGDVASALGLPLERLTYLYGTTMTQERLYTKDLLQFTTSGIPIVKALADQFGVTSQEVQGLVEAGRVGFPEVKRAFEAMTGAGGQFHGMMEKMSETVSGRIEKLKDAIDVMFNGIGESSQGAIYTAIDGAATLVDNYKQVGTALAEVVTAFGLYKAGLLAAQAIKEVSQKANYEAEARELYKLLNAEQQAAISKRGLKAGTAEYLDAVKSEVQANKTAAQSALDRSRQEVKAAYATKEARLQEMRDARALVEQRRTELASLKDDVKESVKAAAQKRLAVAAEKVATAESKFYAASKDFSAKKIAVETAAKQANTVATNQNAAAERAHATVMQKVSTAGGILANKMGIVAKALSPALWMVAISAVLELGRALYEYATELDAVKMAQEAIANVTQEVDTSIAKEKAQIESLIDTIRSENSTNAMKIQAQNKLLEIAPSIYAALMNEKNGQEALTQSVYGYIEARRLQLQLQGLDEERDKVIERQQKYLNGKGDLPLYQKAGAAYEAFKPVLSLYPTQLTKSGYDPFEEYSKRIGAINKEYAARDEAILWGIEAQRQHTQFMASQKLKNVVKEDKKNLMTLADLRGEYAKEVNNLNTMRANAIKGASSSDLKALQEQERLVGSLGEQIRLMSGEKPTGGAVGGSGGGKSRKGGANDEKKRLRELQNELKEREEALKDIAKLMQDGRRDIEEADIEAMDEGTQKKIAKLGSSYRKELAAIEKWKAQLMEANKKATGKESLTEEQKYVYDDAKMSLYLKQEKQHEAILEEWKRKEAEAYDEMLQTFAAFKERQEAIEREYARKIQDAQKDGRTNEVQKLERERDRAKAADADKEMAKDEVFVTFFKHTERQSLKTAKIVKARIEDILQYLKTKGKSTLEDVSQRPILDALIGDEEKAADAIEKFTNQLESTDDVIEGLQNQKVFDALIANFKKLRTAAAGSREQFTAMNNVISGLSSVGSLITQLGNAMADCDVKAGKVVVSVGNAITSIASFAGAGASVGGVWGAIVGAVVGAASAIIPALGKIDEWSQSLEKSYDSQLKWLDKARDSNIELIKGYGSVAEKIDLATKAIENNAKALELLNQKSRELREYQSEDKNGHSVWYMDRQKVATAMRDMGAFDNYDEWEKTHVTDAKKRYEYNKYVRNPKNVHSTQGVPLLLEAMQNGYVPIKIKAEFDKQGLDLKKFLDNPSGYLLNTGEGALNYEQMKWLQDTYPALLAALDSRQRELVEDRMERLKKEHETIKEGLKEAFAGVSFDGLLSDYENALKSMEDGTAVLAKSIEGHLRNAIIKGVLDGKTKERIRKAYENISDIMKNRDKYSEEEFREKLKAARAELEEIYREVETEARKAMDKAGLQQNSESKENTLRGALARASQESIELLAGQLGAMRVAVEQILAILQARASIGADSAGVASFYTTVRESISIIRELQTAGWKEVTTIRETVQQMRATQIIVADLSKVVADNTASIKESNRRSSEALIAINNSGVKIKGGGLGL